MGDKDVATIEAAQAFLEALYWCPVCIMKGWQRKIIVEVLDYEWKGYVLKPLEWQWRCSNRRCEASQDWQKNRDPARRKGTEPKMGYEKET